ncbi:MAG: anti-sigma factor family protein [Terriglobia bacterium]
MKWHCAQVDLRLDDYLEGRLRSEELAAAEAHVRACPRCAEWLDARRATLWLRQMERLESPPGLETRILAQTVAPPPRESLWAVLDRGWRTFLQPRFALGLGAALFSAMLVLNALDVSFTDIRPADLNPANIYRALDRKANLAYARGVRFINDLRLVYEIRSRLEELEPEAEPPASSPPPPSSQPAPPNEKKPEKLSDGAQAYWLLAYPNLGVLGELR